MKPASTPSSRPGGATGRLILACSIGGSAIVALLAIDFDGKEDPASTAESKRAISKSSDDRKRDHADEAQKRRQEVDSSGEVENGYEFAPLPPFDQEELDRMARSEFKDLRRMADLVHRAAAEKDRRFLYLLDLPELRVESARDSAPSMELALAAYDYSVNGNEKALDRIFEIHACQDPGSDSDSLVTLSYLDEWDRTIEAYHNHFRHGTDGAGGDAKRSFWEKRKRLFPRQYRKFRSKGGVEMPEPAAR